MIEKAVDTCVIILLLTLFCCGILGHSPPVLHENNRLRLHADDTNHIREHLDGVVEMANEDKMDKEETQFHYFKVHDYDNNNKLDGIELISALTHYHKEEDPGNAKPLTDEDLSSLVDTILKEDDNNNDGYVDYTEFVMSQGRD